MNTFISLGKCQVSASITWFLISNLYGYSHRLQTGPWPVPIIQCMRCINLCFNFRGTWFLVKFIVALLDVQLQSWKGLAETTTFYCYKPMGLRVKLKKRQNLLWFWGSTNNSSSGWLLFFAFTILLRIFTLHWM